MPAPIRSPAVLLESFALSLLDSADEPLITS